MPRGFGRRLERIETRIEKMKDDEDSSKNSEEVEGDFEIEFKKRYLEENQPAEENEEKVTLPMMLGMKVWEILEKEHGIEPRKDKLGVISFDFSEKELELIEKLKFKNPIEGCLKGISKLKKLKKLEIKSFGITAHNRSKDIASIGDKDIEELEECSGLEDLSITNQAKLDTIYLDNFTNLRKLTLVNNKNLSIVEGIDKITNIQDIMCYGNDRLHEFEGLDKAILQAANLYTLDLDVLLFPNAIGYNSRTGEHNSKVLEKIEEVDTTWKESFGNNRSISINNNQMIKLHNKACEIIDECVPKGTSIKETIIGIEGYIANNIKYDYDSLEENHTNTITTNGLKRINGPKFGANGAFNALVGRKSVCEGFTRGMQYLLKLKGINSHNVDCFGEKDTTHMAESKEDDRDAIYILPKDSYHSIICIDDYYNLYDDPCWNAIRFQKGDKTFPYLLKTKEEIAETHTLSFEERSVTNNHLSQDREAINKSIKGALLFIDTRKSSIDKTRNSIRKQVRGQIVKKGEPEL